MISKNKDDAPAPAASPQVGAFAIEMVESPIERRKSPATPGACRVFVPPCHPIGSLLEERLRVRPAPGATIACLPPRPDERHIDLLLEAAKTALDEKESSRFVLVQHGGGAASFAKSLHGEAPHLATCIIDLPPEERALAWLFAEIESASGLTEAYYDETGRRREMALSPLDLGQAEMPIGEADLLLVTGGGNGITAECALHLARETGAALALIGLSKPVEDQELAKNLKRMDAARLRFEYFEADVTDEAAVRAVVSDAEKRFGPVTAVLHGAGINVPQPLGSLTRELALSTLAVKVQGARNLLSAIDAERLKVFIAFSSILARAGLPREAHYGLANEWLTRLTEQFQRDHPLSKCLAVEWSVWSGAGMAERTGSIAKIVESGIAPITPHEGTAMLGRLLRARLPAPAVVVGRHGEFPTLRWVDGDTSLKCASGN